MNYWKSSREIKQILRTIFHLVIVLIFFLAGFWRAFTESIGDFFIFFTHWSWTFQAIVYLFLFIGLVVPTIWKWITFLFYIAVVNLAAIVEILVLVAIGIDAGFLLQYSKDYGGEYAFNKVLLGNFLFHSIPVVTAFFFVFIYWEKLRFGLHEPVRSHRIPWWARLLVALWQIYGPTFILAGVYFLIFDVQKVYHVHIPIWSGWIVVVCTASILGGFLYYYSLPEKTTRYYKSSKIISVAITPAGKPSSSSVHTLF